jgi:hypothetical protein
MRESSQQNTVELSRQTQIAKQMGRLYSARSGFDRKSQFRGLIPCIAEFGRVQFVERQVIGNLLSIESPFRAARTPAAPEIQAAHAGWKPSTFGAIDYITAPNDFHSAESSCQVKIEISKADPRPPSPKSFRTRLEIQSQLLQTITRPGGGGVHLTPLYR